MDEGLQNRTLVIGTQRCSFSRKALCCGGLHKLKGSQDVGGGMRGCQSLCRGWMLLGFLGSGKESGLHLAGMDRWKVLNREKTWLSLLSAKILLVAAWWKTGRETASEAVEILQGRLANPGREHPVPELFGRQNWQIFCRAKEGDQNDLVFRLGLILSAPQLSKPIQAPSWLP